MEFSAPIETVSLAKFSSKGQHVAHLHNNSLLVRESDGMRPVVTAPCSEPLNRVEWSPNGELVFGVSARRPVVSVRSDIDSEFSRGSQIWSASRPQAFATIDCGRTGLSAHLFR